MVLPLAASLMAALLVWRFQKDYIQTYLDQRKPGTSKYTTQRKEDDKIEILSGIFEGKTTGTPIGLVNKKQRSKIKRLR